MRPTLSSLILLLAGVALGVASKRWSHNESASKPSNYAAAAPENGAWASCPNTVRISRLRT